MPDDTYVPDAGETFHFELFLDGPYVTAIGDVRGCDTWLGVRGEGRMIDHYLGRMRTAALEIVTDQTTIRHLLNFKSTDRRRIMVHCREEYIPAMMQPPTSQPADGRVR